MTYSCPDCGHTAEPADIETAAIVDGVIITCAGYGTSTIKPVAFASAARERNREEVDQ